MSRSSCIASAASARLDYLAVMGLLSLFAMAGIGLVVLMTIGLLHRLAHPPRMSLGRALARGLPEHPGELGLSYELRTYSGRAGGRESAWIVQGGRAAGPMVVVTHGWGDSRYGSQLWAPLLWPYASQIVLYDLRGHGESPVATSRCGLEEPDDLLHLLDQLDAEAVVLMGYSLGACVSVVAAAKDARAGRNRVVGVVGDGIYRWWHEPIVSVLRARRWPGQPMLFLAGAWMWIWSREFRRFDRARWAADLRCPLLLLHGESDPICPLASAQAVAAAAPDARLVVFPGGGHLDLVTSDPDRYRDALAGFFSRLVYSPRQGKALA